MKLTSWKWWKDIRTKKWLIEYGEQISIIYIKDLNGYLIFTIVTIIMDILNLNFIRKSNMA